MRPRLDEVRCYEHLQEQLLIDNTTPNRLAEFARIKVSSLAPITRLRPKFQKLICGTFLHEMQQTNLTNSRNLRYLLGCLFSETRGTVPLSQHHDTRARSYVNCDPREIPLDLTKTPPII